jgi:purine-binding chemotaxis protein CheW
MTSSYLLFLSSGQLFGMRLVGAIEIMPWRPSRQVPLSYSYVEGLLDYRGIIYPVYNLGQRLGFAKSGPIGSAAVPQQPGGRGKSIILLEENKMSFGIVADDVVKMTKLEEQTAAPEKIRGIDHKHVRGLVYDQDHEIMILDFERLFHAD